MGSEMCIRDRANISGGSIGDNSIIDGASVVNMSGGSIGDNLTLDFYSELNFSGGCIGDGFIANSSFVNIYGSQFVLNGDLLDSLVADQSFTITEPIESLSGVLADGQSFDFESVSFELGTTVTVTLIAGPTDVLLLGDVNLDGVVDFLDIPSFIGAITGGGFQIEADINKDGAVDFLDIPLFTDLLT